MKSNQPCSGRCVLASCSTLRTVAGRLENLKPWPKSVSGNPKGRSKCDISAEIARAVFENNPEAIYTAMVRRLIKGDVRAFKILAERGYGKVKEHVELELTAEGVAERLQAARQRLGEVEFIRPANERERKLGVPNVTVKVLNSVDERCCLNVNPNMKRTHQAVGYEYPGSIVRFAGITSTHHRHAVKVCVNRSGQAIGARGFGAEYKEES